MIFRSVLKLGFLTSGLLILAVPAQAQFAFGGDSPIKVDADRAEYKGRLTILTGQVQVIQDSTRILADRMDLYRAELGGGRLGDIQRIDATGSFFYITPEEKVRGEKGVYEQDAQRITVTGDVVLEDNTGNIARGSRLVYDLNAKQAILDGNCQGRKCETGRVNIIINNNGQ